MIRGSEDVPGDLWGRPGTDRLLSALGTVVSAYRRISVFSGRRRPPVTPVTRERELVVDQVRTEAEDVVSLRLVVPREQGGGRDGNVLPRWRPGAHIDLVLPSGRMRQYSLCGDPADATAYRVAVRLLQGGTASREVHDELRPGSRVTVRGPRNAFPLATADSYLFVAGGVGITPILPMVRAAEAAGAEWRLVYTGRTLAAMPFLDELSALDDGRIWIRPDTEYGMPASGAELLERAPAGAAAYCCGPNPMITSLRLDRQGSRVGSLHFERFAPPPIVDGAPFEVELARSGRTVIVPADRSALEAIREVVPDVAYSCRQGHCGTCAVGLRAGTVDHRDSVLTEAERERTMMICVSRSPDRVVLDL
ncbi:PDR/VanB family oxidoreductase [Haloechinothrix sp. LS1_15]|uniref:PDR/VanB family oxidoreductase n=1 Tax=Haloechinothrix sp. LS1_15 TaxID=2652248 RepID=UPI0029446E99|nr:PDR/VanB family oxidoreductase [Haloechinothrix sp. LS1_15]MDV6014595.1 oxidoreductase [Haloechinothrix sp. LS1_15]